VPGLDELGARAVGERPLRTAVTHLRALRAARSFRGTRSTPAAAASITDGTAARGGRRLT